MTYKQALAQGYRKIDTAYQRKYVSRKVRIDDQPVIPAGGTRKGQFYVEIPNWSSTQYSIRQYLVAPED